MHVEGGRGPPFGTPKMTKMTPFWPFWHFECPNQNSKTTFQYKLAPNTLGTQIGPRKVISGHFAFFDIFTSFSLEHGPFFQLKIPPA